MKLRLFIVTISLFSVGFCATANAGNGSGKVSSTITNLVGRVMFVTPTHTSAPFCATAGWAISGTTTQGKSMYAALLTAIAMDKPVNVSGTGTCDIHPNRESVQYIQFSP